MPAAIPIPTLHLFPKLDQLLLEFLRSLHPRDWDKRTLAPQWTIKDIAAHLLDGNLRSLSMLRDGHAGESPGKVESYTDLLDYLNRLNADWVQAFRRISPSVLIELLASSGKPYHDYLLSLDPFATATFAVAWAGEEQSANWFHIAREYTEKWHHQQQMRLALGQAQALYQEELYYPYLETSMRALPHHYRKVSAPEGTTLRFAVTGIPQAEWFLQKEKAGWQLISQCPQDPTCVVELRCEIAWQVFTKGITKDAALPNVRIEGERAIGEVVLDMLAVMA